MSTEISQLQEHRTRLYKHANRPVPLQNIRLNISENPYHRVIRGNTYNLRSTSSGTNRLTQQTQQLPQNERYLQPLQPPHSAGSVTGTPQRQNYFLQYPTTNTPMRQSSSKKQYVKNMRRTRTMNPNEDPMMMMSTSTMPFNRKSLFVQTEEQELIHLRPEQDAEVQTEQVIENPLNRFGGQYREVKERGVDKSTQCFPEDPEIFVFDKDVKFILEKLVGTTLVQCMGEVLEEEEINAITRQNKHHKMKTNVLLHDRKYTL